MGRRGNILGPLKGPFDSVIFKMRASGLQSKIIKVGLGLHRDRFYH